MKYNNEYFRFKIFQIVTPFLNRFYIISWNSLNVNTYSKSNLVCIISSRFKYNFFVSKPDNASAHVWGSIISTEYCWISFVNVIVEIYFYASGRISWNIFSKEFLLRMCLGRTPVIANSLNSKYPLTSVSRVINKV